MSRGISVITLAAVVAVATSTDVKVDAANQPSDRLYSTFGSCSNNGPIGEASPYFPCFSCMNVASSSMPTSAPNIGPASPTSSPTKNSFPISSIYTHCFLETNSVYSINFAERDCKGPITFDYIENPECPDCTGCNSYSDCGLSSCPSSCCGFIPECGRCVDALACSIFPEECQECPGCSNPNPYCESICSSPEICELAGITCSGCPGCSNPPGGNGTISNGRLLNSAEALKEKSKPTIELPEIKYFSSGRMLDSQPFENFTSKANFAQSLYDSAKDLAVLTLHSNSTCPKNDDTLSSTVLLNKCLEMQPNLISETYAVKVLCSSGDTIMSTLKGYHSMQECEANSVNTTVAITVPEGQCMSHEGSSSGLVIQCTGWGKIPPTPSPPVLGPNDVAFGARLKYPDRRCVQGTGQVVSGGIVPCDKCVAYAGQDYRKINCATGELALFSTPDCTGTPKSTNPREACAGLGSIRGIYNFEKIYKPLNSVAFFSAYLGSKGCFAENVAATGGVEAGVCTEIKTLNGAQNTFSTFVKVNCNTHTVNIYASSACDSQASFSNSFTDNTCISLPGNQGFISVSCSGYQTPLSNTIKTASPTTPTTKPPSKAPTSGATSNIQMSQIVQAFVLILVAVVVH